MNTTFSFNRLGLLINRYFVENKQRELNYWGIVTIIFMFLRQPGTIEMFLYISGFIFATRMFKIFKYTPGGMHFLLIPATHLEKLVTAFLISTVYYFLLFLITYTVGTLLGTALGNYILSSNNLLGFAVGQAPTLSQVWENNLINQPGFWNIFVAFAIVQAVFILGSLYFKGNTIGRTFLALIVISIFLGILEIFLLKTTFGSYHLNGHSFNLTISGRESLFPGYEFAGNLFMYLLIPFFWVVSYFRLTEKQV